MGHRFLYNLMLMHLTDTESHNNTFKPHWTVMIASILMKQYFKPHYFYNSMRYISYVS
jgi:hypothetical protein